MINLKDRKFNISGGNFVGTFGISNNQKQIEFKDGTFSLFTITNPADLENGICEDYGNYTVLSDKKITLEFTKDRDGFNDTDEFLIVSYDDNKIRLKDYQRVGEPEFNFIAI